MARKIPSTDEILSLSFEQLRRLPTKTLKAYISRVGDTANKRAEALSNKGYYTYALDRINKSGGRITTKGKTTTPQLLRELARAREFLTLKTSTIRGAIKQMRFSGKTAGGLLTDEQASAFWKAYRKLEEEHSQELIKQYYGSDNLQEDAREIILNTGGLDDEQLYDMVNSLYTSAYKESQGIYDDDFVEIQR